MTNQDMIRRAAALLRPYQTPQGRLFGDVAAVAVSASGKVFDGVCVDTASWGLCAERAAMAAMITDGEYRLDRIVAVWRDPATGRLSILPPCGTCREFMRQVDDANLDAQIVLEPSRAVPLSALLPEHHWPAPIDMD
ncbi:MAG: hypothetical protein KIT02_10960 [Devosia sp.]|uniref:cytidine deaminase family protein n=1 Tax=Devosia sp. TaxID=1871048 RepID=UPI0024CC179B|nr:cytidine deaminase [Devosia sp.]UYN98476.1 MAG: hypothetical protein KIT02_10960 [Devosia sp.]